MNDAHNIDNKIGTPEGTFHEGRQGMQNDGQVEQVLFSDKSALNYSTRMVNNGDDPKSQPKVNVRYSDTSGFAQSDDANQTAKPHEPKSIAEDVSNLITSTYFEHPKQKDAEKLDFSGSQDERALNSVHLNGNPVHRLDDMCVGVISRNFNSFDAIDQIPYRYRDSIIACVDLASVDILKASRNVACEKFWHRMCLKWAQADVKSHGSSFKRMYFELLIQGELQTYRSSINGFNRIGLMKKLEAALPFVHSITITELREHINLREIFKGFVHLKTLDLIYGASNLGMNYDEDELGMKPDDAIHISSLLSDTDSLRTLRSSVTHFNDI
jgi:hypothetical protein